MKYSYLGNTGIQVSGLCMGTMTFGSAADEAMSHKILDQSVEAGINFFDTADVYNRSAAGSHKRSRMRSRPARILRIASYNSSGNPRGAAPSKL